MTSPLGKGLSALMAEDYSQKTEAGLSGDNVAKLPISSLTSGKYQPRQYFDDTYLNELSESIKENGVMQPIIVRSLSTKRNGASYEIVAGERRWRASKLAGLEEVPVIIRELEDNKALEIALVENIQRQDLNMLEEAEGYQQLIDMFSYTQEVLSKVVGKSRSYVANALRLIGLPDQIKQYLNQGVISSGHARALLMAKDMDAVVKRVIKEDLNVRQTEYLVKNGRLATDAVDGAAKKPTLPTAEKKQRNYSEGQSGSKDPDLIALEERFFENTGIALTINDKSGAGHIAISYHSFEELDALLNRLNAV
jgi:ParB family transcriptional regulator, chromosome partitioning protein